VAQPVRQDRPVAGNDGPTYARVGYTLLGGLWLSIVVMAAGLIVAAIRDIHQSTHVTPLQRIVPDLEAGKPSAVLALGILLLFATPFVGVLVALFEFFRLRDIPFVWVTTVLLVILLIGFAIALR
jgi:uncharacterized membrane protein